jgi:DNA modification methylase
MPSDCVDLVYLDPPFFSNRTYEVIWGDEAEVRSFQDRWEGGVGVYVDWMQSRIEQIHRVLKPTGWARHGCGGGRARRRRSRAGGA